MIPKRQTAYTAHISEAAKYIVCVGGANGHAYFGRLCLHSIVLLFGADEESVDVVFAQKLITFITVAIFCFVAPLQAIQCGS